MTYLKDWTFWAAVVTVSLVVGIVLMGLKKLT